MGRDNVLFYADKLTKYFGGVHAAEDVDMEVRRGEILGLIGPNGAGKTTVFNVVTGFERPTRGAIYFKGREISGLRPDQVCALGIGRTFQNIRMFRNISVLNNVKIGAHSHLKTGPLDAIFGRKRVREEERALDRRAREILELVDPRLLDRLHMPGGNLPYADQRRLEIARVLATQPELLLLDEPTAGMNEGETAEVVKDIAKLRDMGYTIILVEHKMRVIMGICDRIVVLNYGVKIAEGTPKEIAQNEQVIEAYLGHRRTWETQ